MKTTELKQGYSIFGNKGNVWSDTAHIYKSGTGNLCGTPALSNNWARIEQLEHIGCPECLEKYKSENQDYKINNSIFKYKLKKWLWVKHGMNYPLKWDYQQQ